MSIHAAFLKPLTTDTYWQGIKTEASVMAQLKKIANVSQPGKGGIALFTGLPGTGKTFAAQYIAAQLGWPLYRVDLAAVINKYIGETEKNLSQLFEQAEETQAILLFDEADALFGKRTDVKDAHDRYANMETNYLLDKIEQYTGLVILTSNLQTHIDGAFMQRVQWTIDFPPPRPKRRLSIWRRILSWFGL